MSTQSISSVAIFIWAFEVLELPLVRALFLLEAYINLWMCLWVECNAIYQSKSLVRILIMVLWSQTHLAQEVGHLPPITKKYSKYCNTRGCFATCLIINCMYGCRRNAKKANKDKNMVMSFWALSALNKTYFSKIHP